MRKIFIFIVLLFFSCQFDWVANIDHSLISDEALDGKLFQPKSLYPFDPVTTDLSASKGVNDSGDYLVDKICLKWNPISDKSGISYIRAFFYDNKTSANDDLKLAKLKFYEVDNLSGQENYSYKMTYTETRYEHGDLNPGSIKYYILKLYDNYGRIIGYSSSVVTGETSKIAYNVEASKQFKENKIILKWNYDWDFDKVKITRNDKEIFNSEIQINSLTDEEEKKFVRDAKYYYVDTIDEKLAGGYVEYTVAPYEKGQATYPTPIKFYGLSIKEGAPPKIEGFSASKGIYKNKIVFSWTSSNEATELYIYKKEGSNWVSITNESIPISEKAYELELSTDDGKNNKFQFYIVGSNNSGFGPPSDIDSGYRIPYVSNFSATALKHKDKIVLTWDKNKDSEEYTYVIYKKGLDNIIKEIVVEKGTYSYDDDEVDEAPAKYNYKIAYKHSNNEIGFATDFNKTVGIRGEVPTPTFNVTQGTSSNIDLTFNDKPSYLKVLVAVSRPVINFKYGQKEANKDKAIGSKSKPSNYEEFLGFRVTAVRTYSNFTELSQLVESDNFQDTNAEVGYNRYKIAYVFGDKEFISEWSDEKQGYRKITNYEYLREITNAIDTSQYNFTYMHKSGTAALGSETYTLPSGGSASYAAKLNGLSSVDITLGFRNFKPYDLNVQDAGFGTKIGNLLNQSGVTSGYVNSDGGGIYKGTCYVNVNVAPQPVYGSNKYSGTYTVKQEGGNEQVFSWDFNRDEINNMLK